MYLCQNCPKKTCVFFGPSAFSMPEMLYQFFTFFRAHAKKRHECPTSIFLQFSGVHKFRISSSSRFTSFNFVHLWSEGQCMDGWTNGWTNCKLADTILILNTKYCTNTCTLLDFPLSPARHRISFCFITASS